MKKIIITLAVLLLAAPAMATVTVDLAPGAGPNTVVVSFSSDEGQRVRALALDIQVNDPCAWIEDVNCVSVGYNIHPGSIDIDAGGNVNDYGTCAGVLEGNDLTSEQGSLYVGEGNAPSPGDLFIITLGGCGEIGSGGDVGVSISLNALRGGIVMEDAGAPSAVVLNGTTVNIGECPEIGCTCMGDVSGPLGTPDGAVSINDLTSLLGKLLTQAPWKDNAPTYEGPIDPAEYDCADISGPLGVPDGNLSINDITSLLGKLLTQAPWKDNPPTYLGPCLP